MGHFPCRLKLKTAIFETYWDNLSLNRLAVVNNLSAEGNSGRTVLGNPGTIRRMWLAVPAVVRTGHRQAGLVYVVHSRGIGVEKLVMCLCLAGPGQAGKRPG